MPTVTDSELDQLRTFMTAQLPAYLADLERLVNIDCGTYNKAGVDEVGRWFAAQMTSMGADVSVDHNADLGDTIVSVLEGEGGGEHALLIGHLDTVFDDGTAAERPFSTAAGAPTAPASTT